jgi:hypothetical protein
MPEALVLAQYLGLGDQGFGQFAGEISIPNIEPPGTPYLILPFANMHWRQSTLKIYSNVILVTSFWKSSFKSFFVEPIADNPHYKSLAC